MQQIYTQMKKILYIIAFLSVGFTTELMAQAPPPPPPPGGGQGDPPGVPIDGGISLLLAAGVAYGGKKVYDMNKKEEDGE